MKKEKNSQKQVDKKREFKKATENFQKIMREISPFLKKEKIKKYSTQDKWQSSDC